MKIALLGSVIALAIAAPAASATFAWGGWGDFDDGSYGDINFTDITATTANTISFSNNESLGYYPEAHSHGQDVNFTIFARINGVDQTIYTQLLNGSAQYLAALGTISFSGGSVTRVGLSCDVCSYNTFHGFGYDGETSFTLGNVGGVPEPASWAMMIAGFGLVGAAMRRRSAALAA